MPPISVEIKTKFQLLFLTLFSSKNNFCPLATKSCPGCPLAQCKHPAHSCVVGYKERGALSTMIALTAQGMTIMHLLVVDVMIDNFPLTIPSTSIFFSFSWVPLTGPGLCWTLLTSL